MAVLHHKHRIREDPRKPGGSNKVYKFILESVLEKLAGGNPNFDQDMLDGCSWEISLVRGDRVWSGIWYGANRQVSKETIV